MEMVVMRYPVFKFDGDDLLVIETPDDVWRSIEIYQIDYPDIVMDSDGRSLKKTATTDGRVVLTESRAEPDPEQLRSLLLHALRARGQEWDDRARLDRLVPSARALSHETVTVVGIKEGIAGLLRFLRRKK